VDPDGLVLGPTTLMGKLAGKPLSPGGFRVAVWCLEGDHEYFSNVLRLPHWASPTMCWECDCDVRDPAKTWKTLKPMQQGWVCKTTAEIMEHPPSSHDFFQIPGVTSKCVAQDALHIIFAKGILAHLIGSVLHTLCWPVTGRQAVPPATRLALIFDEVRAYYTEHRSTSRLTNLRLSMFCDVKSPHAQNAFLNTKAAESKHLLPAIAAVSRAASTGSDHDLRRTAALDAISDFVTLMDEAGRFLEPEVADRALELAIRFLGHYAWLNRWALQQERNVYHIVPKFHMFHHLAINARYLNPRVYWCFKGEDYVGRISTLAASVTMGVSSILLSHKIAQKYRHCLHFRLTRGNHD